MPVATAVHVARPILAGLMACVSLVDVVQAAEAPVPTTQRWSQVLPVRADDCGGTVAVADPLNLATMGVHADRIGNRFVAAGANGPGIIALTSQGRIRWTFATCTAWADPGLVQHWQVIGADQRGGAWVRESLSHWLFDLHWSRLHHVDARGERTASIDPYAESDAVHWSVEIVDDRLRLVWTETSAQAPDLRRSIDFAPDGTPVARRDIVRADARVAFGRIVDATDGERMLGIRDVLLQPPQTYGDEIVLSRLTQDDVAEHVATVRMPFSTQAFAPDGAVWITQFERPTSLMRLGMDGATAVVDITPALSADYTYAALYRPLENRFLLVGDGRIALLRSDGNVQHEIAIDATVHGPPIGSPSGWLLPIATAADGAIGTLRAATDLAERGRFITDLPHMDGTTPAGSPRWTVDTDGTAITLDQRTDPDGIIRTRAVGYAVPGSIAVARMLRDGFEP